MLALLHSGTYSYQWQSFLGKGSFGQVQKYQRMEDKKTVAIKVISRIAIYERQAKVEIAALKQLKYLDPVQCNLVQWFEEFTDAKYHYLVFEHLDISLYHFMEKRAFQHVQLMTIRPIVQQLANGLNHLKAAGIIHADMKCENVMMVDHLQEPPRVKIIDFGLSCKIPDARIGSKLQSLHYRSPEIMLSLPFTEAIDMWSLGCIAAFMYIGTPLYPGRNEYEMITYMVETQGQPPDNMLNLGNRTIKFFQKDNSWNLKTPEQFYRETETQPMDIRSNRFTSLDDLKHLNVAAEETKNVTTFVDMLKGLLHLDGTKRMTPGQVLDHLFINCASSFSKITDIDQNKKKTFGIRRTELIPSPHLRPDQRSSLAKDNRPSAHSSSNTLVERRAPIALKRKLSDDGDMLTGKRAFNPWSDNDSKRLQQTGQSTSSCSRQTQSCGFPKVERKMTHGKDSDFCYDKRSDNEKKTCKNWDARSTCSSHCDSTPSLGVRPDQRSSLTKDNRPSAHSSSSILVERRAPTALKRKLSDDGDMLTGKRAFNPWSDNDSKRLQQTGQSISSCSRQTQSCGFPKVERKMTHGKDSDFCYDKRSDNEMNICKNWDARSTCSSHCDSKPSLGVRPDQRSSLTKDNRPSAHSSSSILVERRAPIALKRKLSDDGDMLTGKRAFNPWSDNDRKRLQQTGQSISSCSRQTQSCGFPKVERKMTHGKDSDSSHDKRSDNEKKTCKNWDARSTCSSHCDSTPSLGVRPDQRSSLTKDNRPSAHSSSSILVARRAPIALKRKLSDDGDMLTGKGTISPWSDNDSKRIRQTSAGQSTSSCSSSSQGVVKTVSTDQTPSSGYKSSSSACSTGTQKRPKTRAKPIVTASDMKFVKKARAIMKERKRQRMGSKNHANGKK